MRIITFTAILLVLAACSKGDYDMENINKLYGGDSEDISLLMDEVSDMKVYFGHQSVGRNIVGGIEAWKKETGHSLEVLESREFSSAVNAPFVHFSVGRNGDFGEKVDDFVSLMETIPPGQKPVAFFKFCYLDVTNETNVDSEYAYFKEKMIFLKDSYPDVKFVACTVPYTGVQTGLRAFAKKILGRAPYGTLENIKRQEFNLKILNEFPSIMPVFDLAALESTRPDGTLETYKYKGEVYPCLPTFYRSDYGHLNDLGARTISYNLLAFLAER